MIMKYEADEADSNLAWCCGLFLLWCMKQPTQWQHSKSCPVPSATLGQHFYTARKLDNREKTKATWSSAWGWTTIHLRRCYSQKKNQSSFLKRVLLSSGLGVSLCKAFPWTCLPRHCEGWVLPSYLYPLDPVMTVASSELILHNIST